MERYFSATAMAGRLYFGGISATGPWDAAQLIYWDESAVDLIANALAGDRKVRTVAELEAVVKVSERGLPTIKVWIHEDLADAACRMLRPGSAR